MSFLDKQRQRSIKTEISARGVGVHSGRIVTIILRPAPEESGIIFRRVYDGHVVELPARVGNVGDTLLSTCLIQGQTRVATVEHLMSAIAGLGIDNLLVDIDSDEVPIMDGSAAPFIFLLESAGICEQKAPKRFFRIKKRVEVREDDKLAFVEPDDRFKVSFSIDFDHPAFYEANQACSVDFSISSFTSEVSRARTFGFLSDLSDLRKHQKALGADLNNAIVLDDKGVVNEDGLRYRNECVRHKVLDAVGDLYLLGHPMIGHFSGHKSGHALNNKLLNTLLADRSAWEIVTWVQDRIMPIYYNTRHITDDPLIN
jgi:UDP-3-O-[3-hydroxymyristoyl] N-acetylglucosamine deacetylase